FAAGSVSDDDRLLRALASCDEALLVAGQVLLVDGWIVASVREIASVTLAVGQETLDLGSRLTRYPRPDLDPVFPRTAGEALGFIAAAPITGSLPDRIELQLAWCGGGRKRCRANVTRLDWAGLFSHLQRFPNLVPGVLEQLQAASSL